MAYFSSEDYNNIILICLRINMKLKDQHKYCKEDSEKSKSK